MLTVIYKIKPGHSMQKHTRVPTLPRRRALHVLCQSALAIQRLTLLHAIRHLAHIHVDFAPVFAEAIEAVLRARVEEQEARDAGYGARETHDLGEAAAADFRGGDDFPVVHEGGAGDGCDGGGEVVGGAGVADDALEVRVGVDKLGGGEEVLVGLDEGRGSMWFMRVDVLGSLHLVSCLESVLERRSGRVLGLR